MLDWQGLEASAEVGFDGGAVPASVVSLGWPVTTISHLEEG